MLAERLAGREPLALEGEPRRAARHAELALDRREQRARIVGGAHAVDGARALRAHEQLEGGAADRGRRDPPLRVAQLVPLGGRGRSPFVHVVLEPAPPRVMQVRLVARGLARRVLVGQPRRVPLGLLERSVRGGESAPLGFLHQQRLREEDRSSLVWKASDGSELSGVTRSPCCLRPRTLR